MSESLSIEQVRLLRLQGQHLHRNPMTDVGQLISVLCGLQSQELASASLAIRARTQGLTLEDVNHAREIDRSIVLTWTMRGTMHLISSEDIGWLLKLLGSTFIHKTERRYKQLGLSEATRYKGTERIQNALGEHGALTRAELANELKKYDIPVAGQAIHHLVRYTALAGVICFGADRDGELTYVLVDDWLKTIPQRELSDDQIYVQLARCYLNAYAPAKLDDFVRWSGLPKKDAREGWNAISGEMIDVEIGDYQAVILEQQLALLADTQDEPTVRLLPRYDNYPLGHTSRDFMVSANYAKQIHPGGGIIHPSVILDGYAIGTWRIQRKAKYNIILIEPFESINANIIPLLEAEVQDIGHFLDKATRLQVKP